MDCHQILQQYFGYSSFRPGQEELVQGILQGRDVLGIMPTGAGKSICYQVPALTMGGITLVISPLISLMKDQVESLIQTGVRAAYVNSTLTSRQFFRVMDYAAKGRYQIIYVAPERLHTDAFRQFAHWADVRLVAVDEAHCVSQWGQDFRPSYLQIRDFVASLSRRPVVGAFTATATGQVREDIVSLLGLHRPVTAITGFDRPNLYFEVRHPQDKEEELLSILGQPRSGSAIVYCSTRKAVEEVTVSLKVHGIQAARYHAGLEEEERRQSQEDFLYDRCPVMVATNAFGMGIDKSNVSLVVHYNMPKNMEAYYQEAGRAGRDGEPARCILLYSGRDVNTAQYLIDHAAEDNDAIDEETREELRRRDRERLKQMTFYCHTQECLRGYILKYFGEHFMSSCGNCGNCLRNYEVIDMTIPAQMALSCVKRTGERYGMNMIVDILRGGRSERILRLRLDEQSTYGLLRDMPERQVRDLLQQLILQGALRMTDDQYPVLRFGPMARGILFEGKRMEMRQLREKPLHQNGADDSQVAVDEKLMERLKALRSRLADKQRVPAYVVFTNASLTDMCRKRPYTVEEFLRVDGVGEAKAKRYGKAFLEEIEKYESEPSL